MPPPNITGQLHLGHALFLSIQDSLARYYRKSGYKTLWLPGTDHAGIATHEKIMECFDNIPTKEAYFDKAAIIKESNQSRILEQIKRMGASCDWSRLNYTMDEKFRIAATYALKKLNNFGLLYQKDNQWYISMKNMADDLLAKIKDNYFIINDNSEMKKLIHILENIEDWCISRQIPWGFELPIYTKGDKIHIFDNEDEARLNLGNGFTKETSTFDTWFTSSLWPMATLGWPENTEDFRTFYPAQIIETGADILFPWCAKMLMICHKMTGIYPFKEIYLHGICLDKYGRKMSKSLGNGIDPLEIIDIYGTDALRFSLLSKSSAKNMKIDNNDFSHSGKFINKIWNAFKFFYIQLEKFEIKPEINMNLSGDFDEIMNDLKNQFIDKMNKRDFLNITRDLQHSFKHDFCDIWIEQNKKAIFEGDITKLNYGLTILFNYLNMLHCFIPFVTDHIGEYFGIDFNELPY